jgi:CBS domain-containing protein
MQARDVMVSPVITVEENETVRDVAKLLIEKRISAVPVVDRAGKLVGIVTERDLLRAVAARTRAAEARVRRWMTPDPVTIDAETTIENAAQIMFDHNFRHLPVVKDGRPLGIVSLRLLARYAFERSVQPTH